MSITLFIFGAPSAVDAAPFVGTVKVEVEVVTNSPLKAALAVSAFLVEVTLLFHIIVEMMFRIRWKCVCGFRLFLCYGNYVSLVL